MAFILNFMWIIGSVSSLFDFLTFFVLLAVLKGNEMLFQTGWFVELGHNFGFQAPPAEFLVILAALVVAYLGIVEAAKRMFYRHLAIKPK